MNGKMAFLLLPAVGMVALAAGLFGEGEPKAEWYMAELRSLNNSQVTGTAWLRLKGDELKVDIRATGLEANELHPMYIRGFTEAGKSSTCPPAEADTNQDGIISNEESSAYVGDPLLELGPFDRVGEDGSLKFKETFKVDAGTIEPLDMHSIVIHGMKVKASYEATAPVACGRIEMGRRKYLEW